MSNHGKEFALDIDHFERVRSLHRVVRAMHDGECPKCHTLHDSREMTKILPYGHMCPTCRFTITEDETEEVMREFAVVMDRNLAVFEEWRSARTEAAP